MATESKDFQVFLRLYSDRSEKDETGDFHGNNQSSPCRVIPEDDCKGIRLISSSLETEKEGGAPNSSRDVQPFGFETVFRSQDDNASVFKGAVREIVDSALLGYHGTVVSFGAADPCGAGIMNGVGASKSQHGAILRSSEQLFSCIERSRRKTGLDLIVLCSFVAIADEKAFDILAPIVAGKGAKCQQPPELQLVSGRLHGLSQCEARSASQVKKFLTTGKKILEKMQPGTLHTVFTFTVEHAKMNHSFAPVSGTLNLVDIAYRPSSEWEDPCRHASLRAFVGEIISRSDLHSPESVAALTSLQKRLPPARKDDTPPDTPLMSLLGGSLGGNCKTSLVCHLTEEGLVSQDSALEFLHLASLARSVQNQPDKRDLAQQALLSAYLRELGITKMVLDKHVAVNSSVSDKKKESVALKKMDALASPSGTRLRDVQDRDTYVDGRHLLQSGPEDDNDVQPLVEPREEPSSAEAVALALAAAVLEEDDKESVRSEEDDRSLSFSPEAVEGRSGFVVAFSSSIPRGADDESERQPTASPPGSPTNASDKGVDRSGFVLKSAKRRSWREEELLSTPVKKASNSKEAVSVEMLLALLQDPDRGAQRAMVTKDIRLRKDSGGLFSGSSIVRWMMGTFDGVTTEGEAEVLGQLLMDTGAIFHSEGSGVFLDAESLFYYARIGRADPKMLSEAEIASLLNRSQNGVSATLVDPSDRLRREEEGANDTSAQEDCNVSPEHWNRTDVSPSHRVRSPQANNPDPKWNTTDVQSSDSTQQQNSTTSNVHWSSTLVDGSKGGEGGVSVQTHTDESGSVLLDKHESQSTCNDSQLSSTTGDSSGGTRGDSRGGTRGDSRSSVAYADDETVDGTTDAHQGKRPHSRAKKLRKKSAVTKKKQKKSNSISEEQDSNQSVVISVVDEDRIKFFNDSEEVQAPRSQPTSQHRQDQKGDPVEQGDGGWRHGNGDDNYDGVQQENCAFADDDISERERVVGSQMVDPDLHRSMLLGGAESEYDLGSEVDRAGHHRSMLLGTEMAEWSAEQLLAYESHLALDTDPASSSSTTASLSATRDIEREGDLAQAKEKDTEQDALKKKSDKYSSKPDYASFDTLVKGVDSFVRTDYPTPLHLHAATGNNAGVLRELVMMYGVNTTDTYGRSPILFAILGNKLSACSVLVECGADVNQGAVNGVTPLHLAAYFGYKDILTLLLRKGAVLGFKDAQDRSALHYSTVPESTSCLQVLLKSAYSSLVNSSDESCLTALHWAISRDHYQHAIVLVKRGKVAVLEMDDQGGTYLNYCICCAANNTFEELLSACPQLLTQQDSTLTTPLHLACAHPSIKFFDSIMRHPSASNLDVNCEDNVQRTPLHYAAMCNRVEPAKELLQRGARTDVADYKGHSPLYYALKHGPGSTVTQILQDPSLRRETPLRSQKKSSVCSFL